MKKILDILKRFFFPPPGTPRVKRVLPYAILGVLTLAVISGSSVAWNYTNSSEFCGTACHTMPPEYSAYLASPHARVQCVECHIGRDVITTQISRKAGDLRHVVLNITKQFEFPIHANNMRPARDSCETCHFPEKFSDDSFRQIYQYGIDEENTLEEVFLIMKTGGGTAREGLGFGIHWHIENEVYYYAVDEFEQNIPYVKVVDQEGTATEYLDLGEDIQADDINPDDLEQMDCITCHNRVTHSIPRPEDAVSQAIRKGLIPDDLPYVVRKSVEFLRAAYEDKDKAIESMSALESFYQVQYPEIYAERQEEIKQAVVVLQDIYKQNVYPEQKSDWDAHKDNLGHKIDPGCFRCHDGEHLNPEGKVIRLECNLCHSIPVVVDSNTFVTEVELSRGPQPPSHTHTSWIALHGRAADITCTGCHTTPEGLLDNGRPKNKPPKEPGTYCGNEACHFNEWTFAAFDSIELKPILDEQLRILLTVSPYILEDTPLTYADAFSKVFEGRCITCHTGDDPRGGLDLSSYRSVLAGGKSGPGIVPGDLEGSEILSIQQGVMRHFGQMVKEEVDSLRQWIEAGAPE